MNGNVWDVSGRKTVQLRDSEIEFDIISKTERPTVPDGWTTSTVERLLKAVKSYGITRERIALVLSALCIGAVFGLFFHTRFDRSRSDGFFINNTEYVMVGIAQVPGSPDLFLPVYKTGIQVSKEIVQSRGG